MTNQFVLISNARVRINNRATIKRHNIYICINLRAYIVSCNIIGLLTTRHYPKEEIVTRFITSQLTYTILLNTSSIKVMLNRICHLIGIILLWAISESPEVTIVTFLSVNNISARTSKIAFRKIKVTSTSKSSRTNCNTIKSIVSTTILSHFFLYRHTQKHTYRLQSVVL